MGMSNARLEYVMTRLIHADWKLGNSLGFLRFGTRHDFIHLRMTAQQAISKAECMLAAGAGLTQAIVVIGKSWTHTAAQKIGSNGSGIPGLIGTTHR